MTGDGRRKLECGSRKVRVISAGWKHNKGFKVSGFGCQKNRCWMVNGKI